MTGSELATFVGRVRRGGFELLTTNIIMHCRIGY
jgi:hypothetical protein